MTEISALPHESIGHPERFRLAWSNEKVNVDGHVLIKDSTYEDMFGSDKIVLDRFCFKEEEIHQLCKELLSAPNPKSWTFFLFKKGQEYFVLRARSFDGGQFDKVTDKLSYDYLWSATRRPTVVIPR